jgi:hypothetical protein
MTEKGVDDARHEDGHHEVGAQPHAFRDRTRHDRDRRSTKHDLKEEEGSWKRLGRGKIAHEAGGPHPPTSAASEHEAEADHPEDNSGETKVGEVLDRDVDAVLRTREASFEAQESGLHQEDEPAADEDPQDIQARLRTAHRLKPSN